MASLSSNMLTGMTDSALDDRVTAAEVEIDDLDSRVGAIEASGSATSYPAVKYIDLTPGWLSAAVDGGVHYAGNTLRRYSFQTAVYPKNGHSAGTRFNTANPSGIAVGRGSLNTEQKNLTLGFQEGRYELHSRIIAQSVEKLILFNWEPQSLVGTGQNIEGEYPYSLVDGTYADTEFRPTFPSGYANDTERDARLAVIQKMFQHFANVLIPFAIHPARTPSHPAFGARIGQWQFGSLIHGETNTIRSSDSSVVDNWVERADMVLDQTIQFPPPSEYIDGGGTYVIPLGMQASDYAEYEGMRFVDLFKLVGGHIWFPFYMVHEHNVGAVSGASDWDANMAMFYRRAMYYFHLRGIPVIPTISPVPRSGTIATWQPSESVNANSARRHTKLEDGLNHEWRRKASQPSETGTTWDATEQARWTDLGRVGRMVRAEIHTPLIRELRYRYGNRWAVFDSDAGTGVGQTEFKTYLDGLLQEDVISELEHDPSTLGIT